MEVQGRKVKMSIWVRNLFLPLPPSYGRHHRVAHLDGGGGEVLKERREADMPGSCVAGYCRPRTLSHYHGVVLPRCARRHPRCGSPFPLAKKLSLPSFDVRGCLSR